MTTDPDEHTTRRATSRPAEVLLVEDSPSDAAMTMHALRESGARHRAPSGQASPPAPPPTRAMFGLQSNPRTYAIACYGTLYAAPNNGLQTIPLPARLIGTGPPVPDRLEQHRLQLPWAATKLARCRRAIPLMRPWARDTAADGSPLTVDWVRLSGYGSGSQVSRVLDAHQLVTWDRLTYTADIPAGATLRVSVRTGSTANPDSTWSAWTPVASGGRVVGDSRYLQQVPSNTPVFRDIGITNNGTALSPPTETQN